MWGYPSGGLVEGKERSSLSSRLGSCAAEGSKHDGGMGWDNSLARDSAALAPTRLVNINASTSSRRLALLT